MVGSVGSQTQVDVCAHDLADLEDRMSVHYTTTLGWKEVRNFAALSGDVSPLHVDESFGAQSSFGSNLVHGMLIASHFSTLVGVFLPGRNALLTGMDVSFVKPVPVGSDVTVSASITSIQKEHRTIRLRLLAFLNGDEICVEGVASVKILPPHEE